MKLKLFYLFSMLILPVSLIVVFRSFNPTEFPLKSSPSPAVYGASNTVNLKVIFGNRDDLTASYPFDKELTAYRLLEIAAKEKGISLKTKEYDFGLMVEGIDTYLSSSSQAWLYYINGKAGNSAADRYLLSEGDLVEWKYQQLNTNE